MIKDPYLQSVVQINCIPALIIVFFVFFLKINYSYEKPLTKKFIPSVILLLLLIIVDNMDYYCYDSNMYEGTGGFIHRLSAMLGYDMRTEHISVYFFDQIGQKQTRIYSWEDFAREISDKIWRGEWSETRQEEASQSV